jgi:hypothetical protein
MKHATLIIGGLALMATSATAVTTVKTPPTNVRTPFYVSNRAPLAPNPLVKLPIGAIKPKGWLLKQLQLEADGFSGRLTEISPWCKFEGNAWVSPDGKGHSGWEEVPYWLKGFGDLGYVLGDKRIIAETKKWLDGVMSSAEPDGYFGPRDNKAKPDLWPNMPMMDALTSYYEYSGDERVITLLRNYFRWELNQPGDILPGYWDKMRGGDNLQSIYWLYNRTGEAWLLEAARKVHECTARWDEKVVNWHGVNITQGFREPAVFYQQSKDAKHLAAAERNYKEVMGIYGQMPGGMFGADENAREGYRDPRQAAETCSMAEFMHSFQMLTGITGDPVFADRTEEIAFNSMPCAMTPDLKGLHYLTASNQPQLDRASKAPGVQNGGDMFSYNPHDYRCCQHNVAMAWPYYAENLWLATQDRGLAAVLYSASTVTAKVGPGAGTKITIDETTDYPFRDKIVFTVTTPRAVKFPLYLRVPDWCANAKVSVNGKPVSVKAAPQTYIVLNREWKSGDKVTLTLPMTLATKTWTENKNSVSVKRGPLWFSLRIGEQWKPYGEKPWQGAEVFPTTPWNYALVLDKDPVKSFTVRMKPGPMAAQPFTLEAAPITISAKGRLVNEWQMYKGLADTLGESPVKASPHVDDITLIPMGCARLRISAFPVAGDGPDAAVWTTPPPMRHTASHEYDDIRAVSDTKFPKSSNDTSIPRFTWWDHKGTEEWLTYDFGQPHPVHACWLYWFDDTGEGECRVPASWRIEYKDGDQWKPVSNPSGYGVEKDQFNRVTFDEVTTQVLRLVVQLRPGFSGGVLEWKVGE